MPKFFSDTHLSGTSTDLTIDGNIFGTGNLTFEHADTPTVLLKDTTNNLRARFRVANAYGYLSVDGPNSVNNSRLVFQVDGSSALYLDSSQNATFSGSLYIPGYVYHSDDTNTYFGFTTNDEFLVVAGGSNKFAADANAAYMYYQGNVKLQTTSEGVSVSGSDMFNGTTSTSTDSPKTQLAGFITVPGPETARYTHLTGVSENKLGGLYRKGSSAGYSLTSTKDGTTITSNWLENAFQANDNFSSLSSTTASTNLVIEITVPTMFHGSNAGIAFSNTAWRARDVKIEVYNGSSWSTVYDVSNSDRSAHINYFSQGSAGVTKLKYTLTNFATTSCRISSIFANNYSGGNGVNSQLYADNTLYGNQIIQSGYSFYAPIYYETGSTTNYLDLGNTGTSLKVAGSLDVNGTGGNNFVGNIIIDNAAPILQANSSNASSGFRINVTGLDGNGDDLLRIQDSGTTRVELHKDGVFQGLTSTSFVKSGGTSSQFLMADGSVSTGGSGITQSAADTRYVNVTGDTMTGDLNINHNNAKIVLGSTNSGNTNNRIEGIGISGKTFVQFGHNEEDGGDEYLRLKLGFNGGSNSDYNFLSASIEEENDPNNGVKSGSISIGTSGLDDIYLTAFDTRVSGNLTLGSNTNEKDFIVYGNDTGEKLMWDGSESRLVINHDTDDFGVGIFTVGSAQMTQPQLKVGRDASQYWGVYTEDRNAYLVHRQDETDGTMTTRFQQWDSNTSDLSGEWLWQSGDGTGASMNTALTLTQAGNATFAGSLYMPNYIYHYGDANTYFGFNGEDQWKLHLGGGDRLVVTTSQFTSNLNVAAPLYYDKDNTSYYLNPSSTSISLNVAGVIHTTKDGGAVAAISTPRIRLRTDGVVEWGATYNAGTLTWDTNKAVVQAQSSNALHLGANANSNHLIIDTSGNATFAGTVTWSGGGSANANTAYGWGNHASAGYLTSLPSHNHDDRYYTETETLSKFTSTDGGQDDYTFEIQDEGNFSGNKWYHVATINSGNGGLHIRGAMLNHVENFASQKFDLAIQVREENDGGQLEITGTVHVLHNNTSGTDKAGIRVIKSAENGNYDDFKVYIRTTRYQMLTLRLTQQGATTFNTNHSSPLTSEPAPVSGGHVEIDTSTLVEGNYVVDDSTPREIYHEGHLPTYSELGTMAYSNLTGAPTIPSGNFVYTDTTQTISGAKTFSSTPVIAGTSASEGGEIRFGAPTTTGGAFHLDNYQGNFRVHTLATGKRFQIVGADGTGTQLYGNKIEANQFVEAGNTTYYLDPGNASTSLNVAGTGTFAGTGTSSFGGDLRMLSGTNGTTAKIIFKRTDNASVETFIRTNAYWNEYAAHQNEGHKFIDSSGNMLLQLNGGNSSTGNGTLSATFVGNVTTVSSMRAPIFYDTSTFYFIDPAGNSSSYAANLRGRVVVYDEQSQGGNLSLRSLNRRNYGGQHYEPGQTVLTAEHLSGYVSGNGRAVTALVLGNTPFGTATASSGKDIFNITRVNQAAYGPSTGLGSYAKVLNLRGNGDLRLGNSNSSGSVHAIKYYDKASTSYYLDPASSSTALKINGIINQDFQSSNLNTAWTAPGSSFSQGFIVGRYQGGSANQPHHNDNANWFANIYSHSASSGSTASYGIQLAGSNAGGGENALSLRNVSNGSFGTWRRIYHEGHKPTYSELGTMAYSNLTGTPTIPTNNNQLTNGAGYLTSSGLVAHATNLNASDDRDMAPEDLGYTNDLRIFFSTKEGMEAGSGTGTDYQDVLYLNSYSDSSGGAANCLAFDKSSGTYRILHYQAAQSASNWGTAKTIAYTSDIPTDFVSAANGGTFSGDLTINGNLYLGDQVRIGDDAWIEDFNVANAIKIKGNQNNANGYIAFGSQNDVLGRAGTGALTWAGNTIWTAGNDGSGSSLDADLLDGQHASAFVTMTTDTTISGRKTFSHADGLQILSGNQGNAIRLVTNNYASQIADSFSGNTVKSYIYFDAQSSSNDPGYIMHETSASESNEGVLHLCPSDDNSAGDYVSIHGTNDADVIKLHTSGLVETVNLQLELKSGSGDVLISDNVDINGNIDVSGTVTWSGGSSTNANTAYGWGNHASAGYITSSSLGVNCTFSADSANGDNMSTRRASGFYETSTPTGAEGWPTNTQVGNTTWMHLISATHSNDNNYYAMQLAGSFFNQSLFHRNTNSSGTTSWLRVAQHNDSTVIAGEWIRADKFYTYNNTTYYVDPANTSLMNNVNVYGLIGLNGYGKFGHCNGSGGNMLGFNNSNGAGATLAVNKSGQVYEYEKIFTFKVSGNGWVNRSSNPYKLIQAPGVDKMIVVDEFLVYIDYATRTGLGGSGIGLSYEQAAYSVGFYLNETGQAQNTAAHGVGGTFYTAGIMPGGFMNTTLDRGYYRDVPVHQSALIANRSLFFKTSRNCSSSSNAPGGAHYIKIKYRVIDISDEFSDSGTDQTISSSSYHGQYAHSADGQKQYTDSGGVNC